MTSADAKEPGEERAEPAASQPKATPQPKPTPQDPAPEKNDPPGSKGEPVQGRDRQYDEAASKVSDATSRLEDEEFQAAIDGLSGDIVLGDKTVTFQGREGVLVRGFRISQETLGHPYLKVSGLERINQVVRHHGIVAVQGPEGSGRTATLLQVLTGGSRTVAVLRLDRPTDLRTLAPERFRDYQAVILEDLTQEHLDQLNEFEIERLRSELASRWLGFTVAAGRGLPAALTPVVVDIGDPPSAGEVFATHLETAQPSADQRNALLTAPGVRERIDTALCSATRLGRAAELAAFLATYEGTPGDLADRLDEWLTFGASAERQRWFEALPGLRASCTAVALAVFNGLAREDVTREAGRLVELIAPTPENQKRDEVENPFAIGISPLTLRATTTREVVGYVEGDLPKTVMRYTDPDFPRWVLGHVWDHVDPVRPAVVAWLRDLGDHTDPSIRARAAGAAGRLAERAFTTVFNDIIADWAAGPDIRVRLSAAKALSVPASNPALAPTVERLLEGWVDGSDPAWRATAALLMGTSVEPATVTDCLARLSELADHDDIDVAVAVATSLADMLGSAGGALAGHVLYEVTRWMNERNWRGRRFTGHLAFLKLTYVRGDPTVPRRDDPRRAVPTLLIGTQQSEAFARQVSRAWHDGLNERLSRAFASSLTRWAERAERRPEHRPVLAWMLGQAATDARTSNSVERAARSWIPDPAPQTATTVLATLRSGSR